MYLRGFFIIITVFGEDVKGEEEFILLRSNEYLPTANVDSVSAAKHRRFPKENRQSRARTESFWRFLRNFSRKVS